MRELPFWDVLITVVTGYSRWLFLDLMTYFSWRLLATGFRVVVKQ